MNYQKENLVIIIITRALGFPFFVCLAFISTMILFMKYVVNFILFGGEAIAYTDKTQRKSIYDVFKELQKQQEK